MPAKRTRVALPCKTCGKTVFATPSRLKGAKSGTFCSVRCRNRALGNHPRHSVNYLGGDVALIPLHKRDGSISGYATIDAGDGERLGVHRWRLDANSGYACRDGVQSDGASIRIRMHREVLRLTPHDGLDGDHIDRNKLNHRGANLRIVTRGQNAQNRSKLSGCSSKYRGVHWSSRDHRWIAKLKVSDRAIHVGTFQHEDDAGAAVRDARLRLMPYAVD